MKIVVSNLFSCDIEDFIVLRVQLTLWYILKFPSLLVYLYNHKGVREIVD